VLFWKVDPRAGPQLHDAGFKGTSVAAGNKRTQEHKNTSIQEYDRVTFSIDLRLSISSGKTRH
jgi:hypothetical protein